MKYRIQTCKDRLWYVSDYLVPSMLAQGIERDNITIFLDEDEKGCLETCMRNFEAADDDAWYLQDDVIICSDFKERTEQYNNGIICGFCAVGQNNSNIVGLVDKKDMWFSFPCIYIPQNIANGCANWFFNFVVYNSQYRMWIRDKKYDDSIFYIYVQDYCDIKQVLNLSPNLVDHIDYLIGGSKVNKIRDFHASAVYFNEPELIDELKVRLNDNK